jgi:hypothetical protein
MDFAQHVRLVRQEDVVMRARQPDYVRARHFVLKRFRLLLYQNNFFCGTRLSPLYARRDPDGF